jgi:hypothetical protein
MKMKTLLVFILLITGCMFAQTSQYPLKTLQEVNFMPDTTTGWPNSPLAGDTIRVQGMVLVQPIVDQLVDRRTILYYGYAWGCYIQSPDGSPWTGLNIYQADTGAVAKATAFDLCDTASVYEFTGVVTPYGQSTELALITAPTPIPVNLISQEPTRTLPIRLTIDSCFNPDKSFNVKLRKYLGQYVEFIADATHPLVTSDLVTGSTSPAGGFHINDTSGRFIQVYAQSRYYKTGTSYTLRPSYTPPANGSNLPYVRGILEAYLNTWEVVPIYPGDLGEAVQSPPAITNCVRNPGVVPFNTPVTIKAQVVGRLKAKVTSVVLKYNVNGVDGQIAMNAPVGDSVYSGTIPAVTSGDSTFVSYYVQATDNDLLTSTSPGNINTSRYSYFVFSDNRPLTIQLVRYSPFGSAYSSYNGYPVTISGVVTSDTSNIPGSNASNTTRVFIQNGTTPWGGIILGFKGSEGLKVFDLRQGDSVIVTGTPAYSATYGVRIDTLTQLTVVSHKNKLPEAHLMTTGTVGYSTLGTVAAEQWDGCIVTYNGVTIDSANADGTSHFGESYVNDGLGGNHTRITWSDGRTQFFNGPATDAKVTKGDYFASITGILGFTHANYKLCPRDSNDIKGYKPYVVGITDKNSALPTQYKLNQNYPNPFNPSTIISYDLPKSGIVNVKIFNVLGQLVKTLVNQVQTAGTHQVSFNASSLSTGVYFYSLTVDNFTQVKKMMLIK